MGSEGGEGRFLLLSNTSCPVGLRLAAIANLKRKFASLASQPRVSMRRQGRCPFAMGVYEAHIM